MTPDEDRELGLNPHRQEEQAAVAMETRGRLHSRGIEVSSREDPVQVADLLTAVEQFEEVVQSLGGDLMVDDLNSSEPDDPGFVVPGREKGESLLSYRQRIEEATAKLRNHAPLSDG